jgi:diketogulonate reductase-like aldo/keto reductase
MGVESSVVTQRRTHRRAWQHREGVVAVVSRTIELPSGFEIPTLGLGTWDLRGQEGVRAIESALAMGYRHLDTAEMYENHEAVGEAISGHDRTELFITSKVNPEHLHYDDVLSVCDAALLELGTDYLDLFLIHWPNPDVPMQQTFDALEHLAEQGKIRDLGVSNFQPHRMAMALDISTHQIANNQVEMHPYLWQDELVDLCFENDVTVTAYSPLARTKVFEDETIRMIADKHDVTPAQVSLRWLLQKGCIVIPRSSSEEHLMKNMDLYDWSLSTVDVQAIDDIPHRERIINPSFEEFETP